MGINKSSPFSYDESEKLNTVAVDMESIFMRAKGNISGVGAQMIARNAGNVSIESINGSKIKLNHIPRKEER